MSKFYIPEVNFDSSVISKYENILNWFNQNLNDEYQVFIEVKIPSGREIDFLIIATFGCWVIEHKQHDFVEIKANGKWKYRSYNGRLREHFKKVKTGFENPYKQATNSAESFKIWMRNLLGITRKVFPCVAFPDSSSQISTLEIDSWCYISKGFEGIRKNIQNRKWKQTKHITINQIQSIVNSLSLIEISYSDLIEFKANVEKIFRNTATKQIQEVKSIFRETNQIGDNNDWLYSLNLNTKKKILKINEIQREELPFILNGVSGSGKTIISYQILENLIKDHLGFFVSLRDFDKWQDAENNLFCLFKDQYHKISTNFEKEKYELVENEIHDLIIFIIKSIIKIYNEEEIIDQVFSAISRYFDDRSLFLILDGWDEIQGTSISILNKILIYLIENGIPFIISCRSPLDSELKMISTQNYDIPIYQLENLSENQIQKYVETRLNKWNKKLDPKDIIEPLKKEFQRSITPFYLFAFTTTPITDIPKNSAQMYRFLVYSQVSWELFKDRRDYLNKIQKMENLISVLEKEVIIINNMEVSYYQAINHIEYNGDLDISDASINSILGKLAILEITGKNKEISVLPFLTLNPLIKSFIEVRYHPKGLFPFPRLKSKKLQEYFIAEYTLHEYINVGSIRRLFNFDIFLLFSQLLELDERWKIKNIGNKMIQTKDELLVHFLLQNPIQLRPTIQDPEFSDIGSGMRFIQSRWRLGVPKWYEDLFSDCITYINKTIGDNLTFNLDSNIISAFLKMQLNVPEITNDVIYDGYIKDYEYGHISQSREPDYYYSIIEQIFSKYNLTNPEIYDIIQKYIKELRIRQKKIKKKKLKHEKLKLRKAKKDNWKKSNASQKPKNEEESYTLKMEVANFYESEVDDEEYDEEYDEDDDWDDKSDYNDDYIDYSDSSLFDENRIKKIKFLFSIIERSEFHGLVNWAKYMLLNMYLGGNFVEYLLQHKINNSEISILLSIYRKESSSWIDQENGCEMPPEHTFNENVIFTSMNLNVDFLNPNNVLYQYWEILLQKAKDLNLSEFLINNFAKIQYDCLSNLVHQLYQGFRSENGALDYLVLEYVLNSDTKPDKNGILKKLKSEFTYSQEDYAKLLVENKSKYELALENREKYQQILKSRHTTQLEFKEKYLQELKDNSILTAHEQIMKERFSIHKKALLHELQVDLDDFTKSLIDFKQIEWLLKFFNLHFIKFEQDINKKLNSKLSPKIESFKNLIERNSLISTKIAFFRLISNSECEISFEKQIELSQNAENWLKNSPMYENYDQNSEKTQKDISLNDDWRNIESLIKENIPNLLIIPEFLNFFERIQEDSLELLKPDLIADLLFTFDFTNNIEVNRFNWQILSKACSLKLILQILDNAKSNESFLSNTWTLVLKLYPYHKETIQDFLKTRFCKNQDEHSQMNIYHSFLYELTIKLLKLKYFDFLNLIIEEIPIKNLDFIIYPIRHEIFPEDYNEIIQITPLITDFTEKNIEQFTILVEKIINKIICEIQEIMENSEIEVSFSYLFDILVGISPRNKKDLLLLSITKNIYDYDLGKWFLRDWQIIYENKDEFLPLIKNKVAMLNKIETEEKNDWNKKEYQDQIKIFKEILIAIECDNFNEETFKSKIKYKEFNPKIKYDPSTYTPSTFTLNFTDFSESIRNFSNKEKINLLLRLLFGKKVTIRRKEVYFKETFVKRKEIKDYFPDNKKVAIGILIQEFKPPMLFSSVKERLRRKNEYWFAFLRFMIDYWSLDQLKTNLFLFNQNEIEKLRIVLTRKFIDFS